MEIPVIFLSDFYKVGHADQYPDDTEVIYSNMTARSSRMDGINHVVFFGLQYFIKEYLIGRFQDEFFGLHDTLFDRMLREYQETLDNAVPGCHNKMVERWRSLRNLGYLPLEIRALPEGALVPIRVPMLTIKNTKPEFFWLGQWIETLLSNVLWHPVTTATIAHQYRKLFNEYARQTSDMVDFIPWQGHDFSMRGHTSVDSSSAGSAGHLLSFYGTDTIPAIKFLQQYYNAYLNEEIIGGSINATEHSVMTCNGEAGEFDMFRRLLTEVYPSGPVSIVSDSYNLWRVLTDYLPRLKDVILNREGKTIVRPDSGNPVQIICGTKGNCHEKTTEGKGVVQLLYEVFGGTKNSKGYIQLNPAVGCIYGDSITLERAKAILEGLQNNGFASTNFVAGIGSFTYQYVTRDTFGMAFKATAIKRNGQWNAIYKDPITDSGVKKSARGLLAVVPAFKSNQAYHGMLSGYFNLNDYELKENVSEEMERSSWNCLRPVFRDGKLLMDWSLQAIRSRLYND